MYVSCISLLSSQWLGIQRPFFLLQWNISRKFSDNNIGKYFHVWNNPSTSKGNRFASLAMDDDDDNPGSTVPSKIKVIPIIVDVKFSFNSERAIDIDGCQLM